MRVFIVPHGRSGCLRRNVLFTSKQKRKRAAQNALPQNLAVQSSAALNLDREAANMGPTNVNQEEDVEEMDDSRPVDGVRLFDTPSARTLSEVILPACFLMFSQEAASLLYDESTLRIGLCCDFAKSKGFGCMGAVILIFQKVVVVEDARGGKLYAFRVRFFNLPMSQSTNKLTRALLDKDGTYFTQEAVTCLIKALYAGNVARHLLEHPELWVVCCDGASENTGRGNPFLARQNLCGPGGIYMEVVVHKKAWPEVLDGADKAGLLKPLDDLFENRSFKWPTAAEVGAAVLDTPLDTTGHVLKDPAIVAKMQLTYVSATVKAKARDRLETLRVLKAAAERVDPDEPVKSYMKSRSYIGPCRHDSAQERLLSDIRASSS